MEIEARRFNLITQQRGSTSHQMRFLGDGEAAMMGDVICNRAPEGYEFPGKRKPSVGSLEELFSAAPQMKSGFGFLGDEVLSQIQVSQLEIDAVIAQHTKRMRVGLEERQRQQLRLLETAIEGELMRKLKEKDEQIQRIGTLNKVLQERVTSLYTENQLWRDLAQTNEATANSLRTNLEQLLLQVGGGNRFIRAPAEEEDDAVSVCGSSGAGDGDCDSVSDSSNRRCRRCREREACVLLLPCRHLSLCSVCGSGTHQLRSCPVCNSTASATVHVNTSP